MEQADERVGDKRKASEAPNHETLPKQPAQEVLINSQHAIFLDLAAQMREQNADLSTREAQLERSMQLQPPAVMRPPLARANVRHKLAAQSIAHNQINALLRNAGAYFNGNGVP